MQFFVLAARWRRAAGIRPVETYSTNSAFPEGLVDFRVWLLAAIAHTTRESYIAFVELRDPPALPPVELAA
jgi:hypothetical protein